MKKFFISFLLLLTAVVSVNAQILRADELEKYAKEKYGDKWVDAATNDQLYVLLNYWFTATFNDANSVIKLNDKELGTIIAQGYVADIAQHAGGTSAYNVSIKPVIKCDIKDGKVRVTYTVPYYDVVRMIGGGWMAALGGNQTPPSRSDEKWTLDSCFPFAAKDSHKKISCKALVMAHAYSNVVMDKIEECLKNGLTGNENDNW